MAWVGRQGLGGVLLRLPNHTVHRGRLGPSACSLRGPVAIYSPYQIAWHAQIYRDTPVRREGCAYVCARGAVALLQRCLARTRRRPCWSTRAQPPPRRRPPCARPYTCTQAASRQLTLTPAPPRPPQAHPRCCCLRALAVQAWRLCMEGSSCNPPCHTWRAPRLDLARRGNPLWQQLYHSIRPHRMLQQQAHRRTYTCTPRITRHRRPCQQHTGIQAAPPPRPPR